MTYAFDSVGCPSSALRLGVPEPFTTTAINRVDARPRMIQRAGDEIALELERISI